MRWERRSRSFNLNIILLLLQSEVRHEGSVLLRWSCLPFDKLLPLKGYLVKPACLRQSELADWACRAPEIAIWTTQAI